MAKESRVKITYGDGTTESISLDEASARGINSIDPEKGSKYLSYTDEDTGKTVFTTSSGNLPASMTINPETGNIKITAPKEITELPEFKQIFDEDTLKKYSQAYKLNPNYKVLIKEYDETTGEEKGEKEVTIPEWVASRDSALKRFMAAAASAQATRNELIREYGDKAKNMSLTQITMTREYGDYTYIPKMLKNISSFGDDPSKGNPFLDIWDKLNDDGAISAKDLAEIYNRDNFGRSELAGVIASIDGYLKGSDFGAEYYEEEDGSKSYNLSSAKEAAKMIAFKNFLLSHHPDGNWFQEIGSGIETLSLSALYGADRVFLNIANDVEWALTGGQGHSAQNHIKALDESMSFYVETKSLETEAAATLYTLGMIGGTLAGSVMASKLGKIELGKIGGKINSAVGAKFAEGLNAVGIKEGTAAYEALSASSLVSILSEAENISRGTSFAIKMLSAAEKASLITNVYRAFMSKNQITKAADSIIKTASDFLMDTIHDAFLYDSVSLREALEASDEDTRSFWMGQFADNMKWWIGSSLAKGSIKIAGKTPAGKALNVVSTRLINKVAAKIGAAKSKIKDNVAGGSVINKLEESRKKALKNKEYKKANRYARKIDAEIWNEQLRNARKQLGSVKLEWDGLKLTDQSKADFDNAVVRVKALELGIDRYRNAIEYKRQEMVGQQVDPSTGKVGYVNKELGIANATASDAYFKLADMAKKHGLEMAEHSMISQEMIDYWVNTYYEKLATSFSKNDTDAGIRAKNALPIIQTNRAVAGDKLPDDIKAAIDDIVESKIYQSYYLQHNEYGMAKGLLNRALIENYMSNEIWEENGYFPIAALAETERGRYLDPNGQTDAKIADEFEHLEFKVKEGQHYQDPENVRNIRLTNLAQMEINSQMFKAYAGFGSNATHVIRVSGEETEYVRVLNANRKAVREAVEANANAIVESLKASDFDISKVRRRKPIANKTVPAANRTKIVNSMDPEVIDAFLVKRGLKPEGQTITSTVNPSNYDEWYNAQTPAVRKYLAQQYDANNVNGYSPRTSAKDIKSGAVDVDARTKLAQEVADNSNGEKLVLWRTQSTGVDKFYDSAGGTGASSAKEATKWEGGRWASVGGEPWSIGGYGGQQLVFPIKKADILDKTAVREIEEAADEIYQLKYGDKVKKAVYQQTRQQLEAMGRKLEDEPYYEALSKLKKNQLKKVADGDPKILLDLSGKKIIQYDTGTSGKEYVLFPKRNPELFDDGVKDMVELSKVKSKGTYDDFETIAKNGGADFEAGLQRATLIGDKDFAKSSLMNEAEHNLKKGKDAFYQGVLVAEVKGKLRNVKRVDTTKMVDSFLEEANDVVDSYVNAVLDEDAVKATIGALAEDTEASEDFARYIALRQLATTGKKPAHEALDKFIEKKFASEKIDTTIGKDGDIENIKVQLHKLYDDVVENELNDASQVVRTSNPELVESDDLYAKANEISKEIRKYDPETGEFDDTVMYLDDKGRQVFARVDPNFASLYNYRLQIEQTEASALAKLNAATSRLFRYGTTSVNLKSFGNQLFRDFGNALYVGGAWHTLKYYRNNLVDVFGENIVEQIGRFEPTGYEMRQVEALAEDMGQTVEEAAVSRELMRGAANAPSTTEHTLYKKFMQEAYGESEGRLTEMKNKLTDFVNEHKLNPEYWLNDKRENYLRNRVFASAYNDALKSGLDVEQARITADFAMNNATTNFTRQLYHMQAIADSTPYFRAAINGSKSFWRMWSLDPVGISGRIMGGLVLPTMFLVGASLGSEENRKVYKNVPEYQKADSLVFAVRGQLISVPLPQEIASIVAPFRQFVEYAYNTNPNDFWELMMNDVLGFFPTDMTGFSTVDMDKMIQDPTIFDRMSRGVSKFFAQAAPIPLKTAYMIATGVDPYSGKNLRNPEYTFWNDETGAPETLDYSQSEFAKWFAKLPFVKGWMTPQLAEQVFSGVVGSTGSNLLDDITALFTQGFGGALEKTLSGATENLTAPFTVPQYDLTNAIWKRAVRELTNEKNALLADPDMQAINKKLPQTTDPKKREELLSQRRSMVHEYQQKVKSMVERLTTHYQGTFGSQEFAAVIQLLNFNSDPTYQTGSQYMSNLSSDVYYEGRDNAIQTMYALGIDGVHDYSIFGYLTKDRNNNVVMRYNSPTAIMDMKNTWDNQKNYHLANIQAIIKENGLWDKHKEVEEQVSAILGNNPTSEDYDKADELNVRWNAEVMKTLASYVKSITPEAAINNKDVLNYLSGLIELPGEYKKDSKGKYVTNKKLGNGSATEAYIKNYIRNIFRVNDTGYISGHNYSDRQTYDKENKRWIK